MRINDQLSLDDSLIQERFVRASGPGGQHVNTTASAVHLRFDLANAPLPGAVKTRLKRLAGSRLTTDGALVLFVDSHRSQDRNRAEARERLRSLIAQALVKPKPRLKSRPSLSSIKKQKDKKSRKSRTKALRRKPGFD